MAISYDTIPGPASLRKPGVYSEIDNSQAVRGPQSVTYRRLLLGQKLAADLIATRVVASAEYFGRGVMLLTIDIYRPEGAAVRYQYNYEWSAQAAKRAA